MNENSDKKLTEQENEIFFQIVDPPTLVCEQIWSEYQIEKQAEIDALKLASLPNLLESAEATAKFDAREKEFNRRLVDDGEASAREWLENEKKNG